LEFFNKSNDCRLEAKKFWICSTCRFKNQLNISICESCLNSQQKIVPDSKSVCFDSNADLLKTSTIKTPISTSILLCNDLKAMNDPKPSALFKTRVETLLEKAFLPISPVQFGSNSSKSLSGPSVLLGDQLIYSSFPEPLKKSLTPLAASEIKKKSLIL
jgi:hypothetical protein